MKKILKRNTAFLLPYLLFLIVAGFFLATQAKSGIHIYINGFHCAIVDKLAPYVTYLGSGIAVAILVLLLFCNYRFAIIAIGAYVISSIITQGLKHTIFKDVLRPTAYFQNVHPLYFVPGVKMDLYHSFPSGHATTAFAVYFSLALIVEKKWAKFLFLIVALSVAYSRVYLSEHFLNDVYFGSIIGVSSALFSYYMVENSKLLSEKTWLNHSLISKK
ncbi:MAG: phosphatase PAP2 family protein [Bacteroidia bacterium]